MLIILKILDIQIDENNFKCIILKINIIVYWQYNNEYIYIEN